MQDIPYRTYKKESEFQYNDFPILESPRNAPVSQNFLVVQDLHSYQQQ